MIDSGPSEKAVVAAANHLIATKGVCGVGVTEVSYALRAAHAPELGRDRSVCLDDVVKWLQARAEAMHHDETTYHMAVKDATAYLLYVFTDKG